jgi:hypothetical protein
MLCDLTRNMHPHRASRICGMFKLINSYFASLSTRCSTQF